MVQVPPESLELGISAPHGETGPQNRRLPKETQDWRQTDPRGVCNITAMIARILLMAEILPPPGTWDVKSPVSNDAIKYLSIGVGFQCSAL